MLKINITNKELLFKILRELGNKYKIGLHNSTKYAYDFRKNINENYDIYKSIIDENIIISNILKKGLYIPNSYVGISSTVSFIEKITAKCFNYSYYEHLTENKCYVIIVAIPKRIYLDGKIYNIEDMLNYSGVINFPLFNTILPKEFIYGYYIKNINYKRDDCTNKLNSCKCTFDETMEFHSNTEFYGYMNENNQKDFWFNYFKGHNIDISLLSNSNNTNKIKKLFALTMK